MKLIAINRFTFDGYAAREMLFQTGETFKLVGSSESPDDATDDTALDLNAAFAWLVQSGDTVELMGMQPERLAACL